MDQHNIDRLFKEKMDGLEVTPSINSWSQVERQLKINRKPVYYRIAATVMLLAISWILILNQSDTEESQVASIRITHPPVQLAEDYDIPIAIALKEKQESKKNILMTVINTVQLASKKPSKSKELKEAIKDSFVFELESKKALVADVSETSVLEELAVEPIEEKKELMRGTVKITYIASNYNSAVSEVNNTPDSISKFKKFIAFAEKINPGEMLANMKTAKDNLLNGRLKNKKKRGAINF